MVAGSRGKKFASSNCVESLNRAFLVGRGVRYQQPENLLFNVAADMATRYDKYRAKALAAPQTTLGLTKRVETELIKNGVIKEDGDFSLKVKSMVEAALVTG